MPTLLPCAAELRMEGQRFRLSFPLCSGTELACRELLIPGKAPDLTLSGLLGTPCILAAGECCPLHSLDSPCTSSQHGELGFCCNPVD